MTKTAAKRQRSTEITEDERNELTAAAKKQGQTKPPERSGRNAKGTTTFPYDDPSGGKTENGDPHSPRKEDKPLLDDWGKSDKH